MHFHGVVVELHGHGHAGDGTAQVALVRPSRVAGAGLPISVAFLAALSSASLLFAISPIDVFPDLSGRNVIAARTELRGEGPAPVPFRTRGF